MYAGPGGWNYLDFLMTGGQGCSNNEPDQHCPGQTDTEYRTEFIMWIMTASPLIVATDLRNMTAIMKEVLLNKEMISIHQDQLARAGDFTAYWACSEQNACEIWAKPLFDGSRYVALYNKGTQTHGITVDFSLFGVGWTNSLVEVRVRDVYNSKDLGLFTGSYTAQVPSHGAVALKLTMAPKTS